MTRQLFAVLSGIVVDQGQRESVHVEKRLADLGTAVLHGPSRSGLSLVIQVLSQLLSSKPHGEYSQISMELVLSGYCQG